eukprot:gnl/MRDRNA2_/MRDRNA2_88236_c0_seq1.p2 gnl/MRDRNA2_/MRDRNA2_88236_c0~~gnl/MRDRNA2_/MRDRNA2_88236_c0_seq1.p2  ORF type:complete len:244 (-),score=43.42 gnl/MRDRNA2_/MRDRNA2_88236_c0_seq1:203-871(-)
MSLGPAPKVAAHDFRHPLRARETADCSAVYLKKPPVPRTKRNLGRGMSSGALLREKQFFGEVPPNLPGAPGVGRCVVKVSQAQRPQSQETDDRPAGWNPAAYRRSASVDSFSRINHIVNERNSAENQVFEWGPTRQVWKAGKSYANKHILDQERQVDGQRAPWTTDEDITSLVIEGPPRGRKNTLIKEILEHGKSQAMKPQILGRRSVLMRENENGCLTSLG